MNLLLATGWVALLLLALASRSVFLAFFVGCQFLFVGLGLSVFPALGMDVVADLFKGFELRSIDADDFDRANMFLLLGNFITCVSSLLVRSLYSLIRGDMRPARPHSEVSPLVLHVCAVLVLVVGWQFIAENWAGFSSLLEASATADLAESLELRRGATEDYLTTLAIYNLLPAVTILSLLAFYERRGLYHFLLFALMAGSCVLALLLTFQKRPLIIFIGFAILAWMFMPLIGSREGRRFGLSRLLGKAVLILPVLLACIFLLYYFYTGIRFEASMLEAVGRISEIILSRVGGRLSLPAAMYVDFFPDQDAFYGLSNVGLFSTLSGAPLYPDTAVVFSAYSKIDLDGSVAASMVIDAFGQAGLWAVIAYAGLVGGIIATIDIVFSYARTGVSRLFFVISAFVFLYYLSQASIFRSLLGYGGVFYFLVWFFGFRVERMRGRGLRFLKQPEIA